MALLKLVVQTPLFVLGGGSVVVGLDAFYKDGRLYLIDVTSPALLKRFKVDDPHTLFKSVLEEAGRNPGTYAYASYPSPVVQTNAEVKLGVVPPASTIKGVLRTAYLRMLLEDRAIAETFVNAVREALDAHQHPKFMAKRGEEAVFRRQFGRRSMDIFHLVTVREVEARARLKVYRVEVRGSAGKQFYAVGVEPGSVLTYKVAVSPLVDERGERQWLVREEELRRALDLFSDELALFERRRGVEVPQCRGFRLGYGAGRRWKTVLAFIERADPKLYQAIVEYMTNRLRRPWGDRTVKVADGKPVGWVCHEWS